MVKAVGKDESAVKRITCKHCASILEYTLEEMHYYSGTDYSGGTDGCDWINCPNCGNKVIIRSW